MENASKALLMAAGVLLGILLLSLMITLFASSSSLSRSYEETKQAEAIQQFNSNFTKYLKKDLTIQEAITILNFARSVGINDIDDNSGGGLVDALMESGPDVGVPKYELLVGYDDSSGYINKIIINKK